MLGSNFISNSVLVHNGDSAAAGKDAAAQNLGAVDLQAHGASRVVIVHLVGAVTANAVLDAKLQTSDATASGWADVPGTEITAQALTANKMVVLEADTNGVELKRYVRLVRQRKTQNSQVLATVAILCGLRQQGRSLTRGDTIAAKIGQQKS